MSCWRHLQLRYCIVVVLAVFLLQFVVVLWHLQHGHSKMFVSSHVSSQTKMFDDKFVCIFSPQNLSFSNNVLWVQFIAHTPDQPDAFFQYNRQLSDKLPVIRSLPVTRHDRWGALFEFIK